MKIVLYGGAFDPFHNGHYLLAKEALKELEADKLLFVVGKNPPWKKPLASYEERIALIEAAIRGETKMAVSRAEDTDETNYTYLTVRKLKEEYKDEHPLFFFLIGTDQLEKLSLWKNIEELAQNVTFVSYKRETGNPGALAKENAEKYGVVELKDCPLIATSSTLIREGKSLDVPKEEFRKIALDGLYFASKVKSFYKEKRYMHALRVAELAYDIALTNHADTSKALLAGFYHDITKKGEKEEYRKRAYSEYGYVFFGNMPEWAYHQFTAVYLLEDEFGFDDREVLEAIRVHTTGNKEMSELGRILYASDKIEPGRGWESSSYIEAMKKDDLEGFKKVLRANRAFLREQNREGLKEDRWTSACYEYYLGKEI